MRRLTVTLAVLVLTIGNQPDVSGAAPVVRPRAVKLQDGDSKDLENRTFSDWTDGVPDGWTVAVGATNGAEAPLSEVKQGPGPSLELSGNAQTKAWRTVGQTINAKAGLKPGQTIHLTYTAKAVGIKRERQQFNNCYVAVFPILFNGKKMPPLVWPVESNEYQTKTRVLRAADNVARFELLIFLSQTGILNVKDIKIESKTLKPEDSFDLLVQDMSRHYSFFELKKIDWPALSKRYRNRAIQANSPERFAITVAEMLDQLEDTHVGVKFDDKLFGSFSSRTSGKQDFGFVKTDLTEFKRFGKFATIGMTTDGYCYINFHSLANVSDRDLRSLIEAVKEQFDSPGMIIDLRENGGGSESVAQAFSGLLIDKEIVYAKSVRRNGDRPSDFSNPVPRILKPSASKILFLGPVVCLIGPNAVSSAEGFAMMMKAIPNCTLVGQPTRGASGNPEVIQLPNGVEVWYSRWKSLMPDGTCIEGVGVQPDIQTENKKGTDAAYAKALEILRRKRGQEQ